MPVRYVGFIVGIIGLLLDQALKLWLLLGLRLHEVFQTDGPITLTSFFDLVLVWNKGVSYGWFAMEGPMGQMVLIGIAALASGLLIAWINRMRHELPAIGAGLILGGAIGNALDRVMHGAVIDLFHFHWGDFSWYIFNLADVWIVAGVLVLIFDSFFGPSARDEKAGRNNAAKP